nr:MAG TPA: hypothetical protein [Caudoviricetes sp.]
MHFVRSFLCHIGYSYFLFWLHGLLSTSNSLILVHKTKLQHPASLDSQREDAHSAGLLILLTRMAEKTALTNYLLGVGWSALG